MITHLIFGYFVPRLFVCLFSIDFRKRWRLRRVIDKGFGGAGVLFLATMAVVFHAYLRGLVGEYLERRGVQNRL